MSCLSVSSLFWKQVSILPTHGCVQHLPASHPSRFCLGMSNSYRDVTEFRPHRSISLDIVFGSALIRVII
jgi:hypothetical protein